MQPQSPNPDFEFMLKDNKPAKKSFLMPNLPKPVKIGGAVLLGLILIIVVSSFFSGRKNKNFQPFEGVLARGQETIRVTTMVQQLNLRDPQTTALAATVNAALSSDKQQITTYLAHNHIKVSGAMLASDLDKSSDASLQTASQNNALDAAYVDYLKTALAKYEQDLQTAYPKAGPNGQQLLAASSESTRTLLSSAPIKS